ncbi:MAG: hypothetical protein IJ660_00230 [Alphaproteobacteria bacterium]|nr:hypothetical protein [Alphaproteobacteria bacterium]
MSEQENKLSSRAPQPLTKEEFDEILIRKYFESMSEEDFVKVFQCKQTDKNIEKILQDDSRFPPKFLRVVEKSILETIKVIQNLALDGKAEIAWSMAESLASFTPEELQYIHYQEGDVKNLKKYIRMRFINNNDMFRTLEFIKTVEEAQEISDSSAIITTKNAEKLYNNLRSYEPNLNAEQKSSVYYLASEVYRRAQIVPGIYNEPKPCNKEILCLQMVLENTSLFGMVDCCLDRMSKDKKILKQNIPLLISAYKRVLKNRHVIYPEDSYRLNSQIAELYQKNISSTSIAFAGPDLEDKGNLVWAEYFYCQAAKKAPNNEKKYEAMVAKAKIQRLLGEIKDAHKTLMTAAALLPEPERYEQMLTIAAEQQQNSIQTIKQVIKKINRQKMPLKVKNILFDKALSITRLKTKDEKVISSVESLLPNKKLTPNNKVRGGSTHE